jgi:hypothetical protein
MKTRFVQMAAWANTDPRRVKVISAIVTTALLIAALAAPSAIAFAGPIGGGSDVGGL